MRKNLHAILIACLTICTLFSKTASAQSSRVDIGKSFVNINSINNGGSTFNPGDTLEIRVTVAVLKLSGVNFIIDSVQVFDTLPNKVNYVAGSMRVTTNQAVTYKGPFTDAGDADPGTRNSNFITINLGNGANGSKGGRIVADSSRPSVFGSTCIMMACYKVVVKNSANYGDIITFGGAVRYRRVSPTPVSRVTYNFTPTDLLLFQENNYCDNGTNVSAASDSLGTFASGTTQNRATGLGFTTTYNKVNMNANAPGDYNYAIVNNSSATGITNVNAALPDATNRVFGLWDICGDHTGATNTAFGNTPKAPGVRGGYFVAVNSSYNTDLAYQETLTNLCPNTYYEFSAWYRNLCPRCGCDSTGKGSASTGYLPAAGNDSSGVRPNLTFEIDGDAYFTTGDIKYDRAEPWKRYGFSFRTRSGQTTAVFTIRNNSPGGGGNDWAMDDINVAHCGPSLTMNYNPYVIACREAVTPVNLSDTIRFAFNTYAYYKWQRSNVGGTVWTDLTGPGTSGTGVPTLVNGQYQYVTNLPTFLANYADSGRYYRVIVATTSANLVGNCSYNDGTSTMLRVVTCGIVLKGDFLQFKGNLVDRKANLVWSTSGEENLKLYDIERSYDGANFERVGKVRATNMLTANYMFNDPELVNGNAYYRLKMIDNEGKFKYSHVVLLSAEMAFEVKSVLNPFSTSISSEMIIPHDGIATINLFNEKGQLIKTYKNPVNKGINQVTVPAPANLATGIYFLSVEFNNESYKRKLFKQ